MAVEKLQVEAQGLQPVSLGDGGAKTRVAILGELGNSARALHDAVAPMAQRATAEQAQQRGQADALKGNFRPQRNASFAAQEYNRAGFQTALSELEINMRARVDEIYNEAKHDPAALQTKFNAYRDEIEKQLGGDDMADILPQFRAMYDRATLPHSRAAAEDFQRTTAAANAASSMAVLESRFNDGERFARSADVDATAQMALLEEAQAFDQHLIEQGPKEAFTYRGVQYPADPSRSGIYSPVEMEKHAQDWTERIAQGAVLGGFDRADGIAGKEAYVDTWEKMEKGKKGSPFTLDQVDQLATRMRIDINKERARSDAFKAQLQKQITEAEKVYAAGKTPAGILALRKASEDYPDLMVQLDTMREDAGIAGNFSRMTPAEQQAVLNDLQNSKVGTGRSVELGQRLEKIHTETAALLKKDPVTLLARNQLSDISPIDMANPQTFANRADEAGLIKTYYGVQHHGLTEAEVGALSTVLDNNTADVNALYLQRIRAGLDDERLLALGKDLMPKNPEFAAAMGVAADRPDIASGILQGIDILKLDTGILPDVVTLKTATDAYFGDELTGLGLSGENRIAIERAAMALDASRRDKAGTKGKDNFDEGHYKQALEDVTGGTFFWHGKKIITPQRGVDADTFSSLMDAITEDDIKGMHNGGLRVPLADFKRHARLQSIEDGKYLVMIADGFATDSTGNLYELDVKAMLPALQARERKFNIMGVSLTPGQTFAP
jgi:hypothetical protein